ncbi:lipoprotein [gut metagenome]|uniref:Lipoprotein n=1 Tax=gut metagenome TaxID=749906 RepID=J9FSU2_9ZZZZ
MNVKNWTFALFGAIMIGSCIQEEALNTEADIETVALKEEGVLLREAVINNDQVKLPVKDEQDITQLTPIFTLTPGATIEPPSGTTRNFTNPQTYTVTSEDGQWKKTYIVNIVYSGIPLEYHFEGITPVTKKEPDTNKEPDTLYYNFFEDDEAGNHMDWTNANAGFNYTGVKAAPEDYPTAPAQGGVNGGHCIKLTTKNTGALGAMLKMYLAAGNLFMGSFEISIPHVVKATKFGIPFKHVPKKVSGYYKYKSGPVFTKDGKEVPGKKDIFDIYGIFYETDDNVKTLDGTNQFTSPNLISIARIQNAHETDQWTKFEIPFKIKPGKNVDMQKLKDGKYNFALVFSSSIKGDLFEGAEGSTLYIDEVKVDIEY